MKQQGQRFFLRLLLLLCLLKIKSTAGCLKECTSINVNATTTEINTVALLTNFTVCNIASENGVLFLYSTSNCSTTDLSAGVECIINFCNDTEISTGVLPTTCTKSNANGSLSGYPTLNCSTTGLSPGVKYIINFDDGTETCCKKVTTKPSRVVDIKRESISTNQVTLTWQNNDTAASTYSYVISTDGNGSDKNQTSHVNRTVIVDLQPGTPYNFTVYPLAADNQTKGDSEGIPIYTRPSPVFDIQPESISTNQMNLTWQNNDTAAQTYTYVISTEANGTSLHQNQTSQKKSALIVGLQPGSLYIFTIYPLAGDHQTKGNSTVKEVYTKPSPVFDIKPESISTDQVTLTWQNNDTAASTYSYAISTDGNGSHKNQTSHVNRTVIVDLQPGTPYNFTVYPLAADNQTKGDSRGIHIYTKPSPVFDIKPESISTDRVTLTWQNNDTAASTYSYVIATDGNGSHKNQTSHVNRTVIVDLQPGTPYNFTVYPLAADNQTKGDSSGIRIYTKPSPVFDIKPESISTDRVTLTWQNNDTAASTYSYVIATDGNGSHKNQTSHVNRTVIVDLQPGTPYNFTVYPLAADNQTKGDSRGIRIYTKPSPVSDIKPESISTDRVTLTWQNNDTAASPYSYVISIDGNVFHKTQTSQVNRIVIVDLQPGTPYNFTVYPLAADNQTKGDSRGIRIYTRPSPVFDIKAESISTNQMNLTWQNNDAAAQTYTYVISTEGNGTSLHQNQTSQKKSALIVWLQPGSLYIFTINPLAGDHQTKGNSTVKSIYTKPSPVFGLRVTNISTTGLDLIWQSNDTAASQYTYIVKERNGLPATISQINSFNNTTFGATVTELKPGTSYTFTVFPQVGDKITNGTGTNVTLCTDAASVSLFNCTAVTKKPELILTWDCPNGNYTNFNINTASDGWNNETVHLLCNESVAISSLNYSTSYNVSITTHSCGKKSPPVQKTCTTSITDPPAPVKEPNITAITHNSFKVLFSGFESKNGPLKAYAVMITTAKEGEPSNSSLKYSYDDFKNGKTNTYITYILVADQTRASSFPADSSQSELEVGNKVTTYGYYNAPLDPLGSYRACVAGFTKIEFNESNDGPIIEQRSYVAFTPYSEKISLPQDPGVITGAVVGCIVVVVVVVSFTLGFVFWRRRRKDGKHNELSFSQIRPKKSKLIKVENFESYFKKQQADSNCGFAEEYEELRSVGINQPKFAAELVENRGKNRYNNVLPYDISRVKLSIQNHPTDDYINANYMPGYNSKKEFIAAQGPLPNTLQDFWRMILEKNIYAIVMLTKCVEQGRAKCEEYWPDKGSRNYGNVTVTLISEFVLTEWTIRDFTVEDSNATESHSVRQFHFTSWPDHGVPETTDLLINFRHLVRDNMKQNPPDSPTLVHCSAGVGRTGTFIAIDRLIQQMEMENTSDVYGVVYDLRMHRPLMVQTEDQYIFLNQCVLDIIKSQKDNKPDLIYQNTTAMAIYENFIPTPSFEKANGYHA